MKLYTAMPSLAQEEPKLQIVYSQQHQLAAVHLISPNGIVSYTSEGGVPRKLPAAPEHDVAWYHHYE